MEIGRDRGDRQLTLRPMSAPAVRSTVSPSKPEQPTPAERRESFRCPTKGPRRHGRLRINKREIDVHILDESTGGFAIETDTEPGCQAGDTLLLEIALAWVEVRVVNLERREAEPDDAQEAVDTPSTRISLERLRDIDEWEANPDERPILSWSRIRSGLVPLVPLARSFKGLSSMILFVVTTSIVLVWLLEHSAPLARALKSGPPNLGSRAPAADPPIVADMGGGQPSEAAPAETSPPVEVKTTDRPEPAEKEATPPPPAPEPRFEVPKKAMRLAHPKFLLKPEVAQLLSLRRNQREELRRIFAEHQATAGADQGERGAGDAQDETDPLVRLGHKSLEVLSDEQRKLLTELHATMESSLNANQPGKPTTPSDSKPPPGDDPPAGE
jgi:hypothetical protein